MEAVHILRLRRLADHLVSGNLSKDYSRLEFLSFNRENQLIFFEDKFFQLFPWFEEELVHVFPTDFTYNHKGIVVYVKNPRVTVIYALPEFFHITTEQFSHCFLISRQSLKFGKYRMTKHSLPKHCGRIIYQFIRNVIREQELESNLVIRRVLIEKIGRKSPEAILRSLTDMHEDM